MNTRMFKGEIIPVRDALMERAAMLRSVLSNTGFGSYTPLLVLEDGELVCRDCIEKEARRIMLATSQDGWTPIGADIHWEGPDEVCCVCAKALPSEYGDPDEKES